MTDKTRNPPFGLSPLHYGITSIIAGCLSFAAVWIIFNQGPDGVLNNRVSSIAVCLLLFSGMVCGVLGVITGLHHRKWIGATTSAVGVAICGYGAALVFGL
jgi:LytS/YehU family sensor histidine kinase